MRIRLHRAAVSIGLLALVPTSAAAQNTSFGAAVHLLVGQSPVRVTLPTATPTRYYDAPVVINRSYCAEATASESEVNDADPTLTVFRADTTTTVGADSGTVEPKGQVAARVCFIAAATETHYFQLAPASAAFENREYALRVVETTLFTNWFFVGADYSSFTLVRNTTNTPVNYTVFWRSLAGAVLGSSVSGAVVANGVAVLDARSNSAALASVSGSVEIAHTGSPEALVGSQTTLSGGTGLSFDTLYFQRRAW